MEWSKTVQRLKAGYLEAKNDEMNALDELNRAVAKEFVLKVGDIVEYRSYSFKAKAAISAVEVEFNGNKGKLDIRVQAIPLKANGDLNMKRPPFRIYNLNEVNVLEKSKGGA